MLTEARSSKKAQLFWMSDRKWLDEALNSYNSAVNLHDHHVHHRNKTITKLKKHNIMNPWSPIQDFSSTFPRKRNIPCFSGHKGPPLFPISILREAAYPIPLSHF
jgi:hypothetical protein